jgi:cytochrome c-type biogenesis protein CcmH
MTQWLVFALMTAAAVFVVLWPLGRRNAALVAGSEVAVYEDQLNEIARDRSAGLIGAPEAEAARVEVSRRLLAADAAAPTPSADAGSPAFVWRRRAAALMALIGVPVGAGGLYLALGSPNFADQPLAARVDSPGESRSIDALVAQVEKRLDGEPGDARGWQVIAPIYLRLGRFDDAVKARRHTLRLLGESGERQADLGEALVAAADGIVTAEAKAAFERAYALDPQEAKAQYYLGKSAEQDGKLQEAAAVWRDLLGRAPPGAAWADLVRESLHRVDPTEAAPRRSPATADIAAVVSLPPEQRSDVIRGMVAQLAERLKRDGSDLDGWLRLVRAYMVLGDREKALDAAGEARRNFGADPDKLRRLDELVKGLGLEG